MSIVSRRPFLLLGFSYLAFVSLGLPDGLLGVAWPSIRSSFALPLDSLGALLIATTAGYVASSFSSGSILARMGLGTLLTCSCLFTAGSLLGYAAAPVWPAMVALGSLAGLGAGAIDAGLNTYVATHHSARTLNLLHAFYGLGTTTGPVIMTSVLMAGFGWQKGYALVGTAQLVLAACFAATGSLWPRSGTAAAPGGRAREPLPAPILGTLGLRAAQLGITAFFVYVGLEATAGAWIFSLLTGARGVSMEMSGAAASLYWGGLMSGRLVFALIPGLKPRTLMGSGIAGSVLASIALLLGIGPEADVAAAALLGFACGPIFPVLIATTPERLGVTHTANGVGFQVAAAAMGQSLLPAFTGVLAGRVGLEAVPAALLFLSLLLMVVFIFLEAGSPARVAPIRTMASDRATMTERPQRLPDQHRGRSSPGLRSGRAA